MANSAAVPQKENSSHIPQELIPGILLRLPVKSLCRFKTVSKSFHALIDGPDFIYKQLKSSIHSKMIFKQGLARRSKTTEFHVWDADDGFEGKILFRNYRSAKVLLFGSCNGLFLLSRGLLHLILWNPATRKYRDLPTCPLKITNRTDYYNLRLGLGYDSVSDDYKVVSIPKKYGSEAWVFGLRSNTWTRIDCEFFPDSFQPEFSFGHYAHGSLHWLYNSPITGSKEIVAFDVAEEKFSQVICPPACSIAGLHVLDGCLCVSFFCDTRIAEAEAHLYLCKRVGDDYFWHKLWSVTSQQGLFFDIELFQKVKVLGYSKEGDKIMMDIGLKFLVSYDLKRTSFEKIELAEGYKFGIRPVMFTESLVSVGVGRTTKMLNRTLEKKDCLFMTKLNCSFFTP